MRWPAAVLHPAWKGMSPWVTWTQHSLKMEQQSRSRSGRKQCLPPSARCPLFPPSIILDRNNTHIKTQFTYFSANSCLLNFSFVTRLIQKLETKYIIQYNIITIPFIHSKNVWSIFLYNILIKLSVEPFECIIGSVYNYILIFIQEIFHF